MEHNPTSTPDNNYEGTNPLDGSPQHPNKYALLEKRQEQINQAIVSVLQNQKKDVIKVPVVGVATLVRRELEKSGGVVIKNNQDQIAFDSEYNTNAIIDELCKIVGFDDNRDYKGLKDAVDAYIGKK